MKLMRCVLFPPCPFLQYINILQPEKKGWQWKAYNAFPLKKEIFLDGAAYVGHKKMGN